MREAETRVRAAWQVLRGAPLMFRMDVSGGPLVIHSSRAHVVGNRVTTSAATGLIIASDATRCRIVGNRVGRSC